MDPKYNIFDFLMFGNERIEYFDMNLGLKFYFYLLALSLI